VFGFLLLAIIYGHIKKLVVNTPAFSKPTI
jgi:hypothetical protein